MPLPFKRTRLWTDPDVISFSGFGGMSYALFRLDPVVSAPGILPVPRAGCILAARSPDTRLWHPGDRLPDLDDLTNEARHYLATGTMPMHAPHPQDPAPTEPGSLFVWTRTGLGLLSRRYAPGADLGLLLHLHLDPVSASRVLAAGVFAHDEAGFGSFALDERIRSVGGHASDRDMPTYAALNHARITLQALRQGFATADVSAVPGTPIAVPLSAITALAAFAGCGLSMVLDGHPLPPEPMVCEGGLTIPAIERHYLSCHSPVILEPVLLGLLYEVRTLSRDRTATCRITSGRYLAAPSITLDYTPTAVLPPPPDLHALAELRTHLMHIASLHGMALTSTPLPLWDASMPTLHQTLTLDWLADPAVLPTSDLKTRLYVLDEDNDRNMNGT